MKKYEYNGKQWHEQCFLCKECLKPITSSSFVPREEHIVCIPCYEQRYAQRCTKCNQVISAGGVTYKSTSWHRECFTCTHCKKTLAGEKFTSHEDRPFCAECYGILFAKKCANCTKPITGLGSTKFVSFEERHWHSDCFQCGRCQVSLVGQGFLTEGLDIVCPECSNQA
jgi:LIM domain-containing protein 2